MAKQIKTAGEVAQKAFELASLSFQPEAIKAQAQLSIAASLIGIHQELENLRVIAAHEAHLSSRDWSFGDATIEIEVDDESE